MKKFLSTILAVIMVLSSMAMVVSADETLADGIYVGTTKYDTFTAAQAAVAGNTNKEIIISGTVEFGSRQGVSIDNLHLRGINDATIIPTNSFGSTPSDTNWKGLLNISGANVIVSDITFDGTVYGDKITASTDFVPVRCTSGTITLNNVEIKGSPRTLMIVGSSSSTASVTANGLYCQGEYKGMDATYADINVAKGTLTLNSGKVNGFICKDSGGTIVNNTNNHYKLTQRIFIILTREMTSTVDHFANSFVYSSLTDADKSDYVDAIAGNFETVKDMVNDFVAITPVDTEVANNLITVLEYAKVNDNKTADSEYDALIDKIEAVIPTAE